MNRGEKQRSALLSHPAYFHLEPNPQKRRRGGKKKKPGGKTGEGLIVFEISQKRTSAD